MSNKQAAPRRPKNNATLPMAVALAATAIGALALGSLLTTTQGCRPQSSPTAGAGTVADGPAPSPFVSDDTRAGPLPTDIPSQQPTQPTKKVTVFKLSPDGTALENVELELTPEQAKHPATAALEAMVGDKDSPLPPGTKVRSVKIADKTATVDFSEEFVKNFPGGDTPEALALNAVTTLLGQFPSVEKVQILVEGKKIDTLGGNQDLDVPLVTPQANKTAVSGAPDEHASAEGTGGG